MEYLLNQLNEHKKIGLNPQQYYELSGCAKYLLYMGQIDECEYVKIINCMNDERRF